MYDMDKYYTIDNSIKLINFNNASTYTLDTRGHENDQFNIKKYKGNVLNIST